MIVACKPYPIANSLFQAIKKEIKRLIDLKIIRESSSKFASPAFGTLKKDGSIRLLIDYRKLNDLTIKNNFPSPTILDDIQIFKDAKYFSTIDLRTGYYRLKVKEEDVHKTSFVTPIGQFEFLRLPFGLCNAPKAFQKAMNTLLGHFRFIKIYLDDIVIFSKNEKEHSEHLQEILSYLIKNNVSINFEKSTFFRTEISYLGLVINGQGIKPDITRLKESIITFIPKTKDKYKNWSDT